MIDTRVVITGLGALTPLGNNATDFWAAAAAGTSGANRITRFNPELHKTHFACELKGFDPLDHFERKMARHLDPFTQYALVAAGEALKDSGLDMDAVDPYSVGVIWASGQGGLQSFEEQVLAFADNDRRPRFNPFLIPKLITNMASGMISIQYGLQGMNYATVSACASGTTAVMDAFHNIKLGKGKAFVVGGSEAPITEASVGGFNAMHAMSKRNDSPETASRPFDANRDGFVMGEGAGALVVEEYEHAKARGARIYAEVVGASMTADAFHMTATHPDGLGAKRGMELALQEAGIQPADIDYLNAHATSTPVGDLSEVQAIRSVFGDAPENLHISGTKSMTGHLLGAAGAVEAILCVKAIEHGVIPPTINTTEIDPEIPSSLNIVTETGVKADVRYAMSNTFGFGGHNAIAVFKKPE